MAHKQDRALRLQLVQALVLQVLSLLLDRLHALHYQRIRVLQVNSQKSELQLTQNLALVLSVQLDHQNRQQEIPNPARHASLAHIQHLLVSHRVLCVLQVSMAHN